MIQMNGGQIALLAAAVARVAKDEHHFYPVDTGLDELTKAIGAEKWSVYHIGKYGEKNRYLRFDFPTGEGFEILAGPQPEIFRPTQPSPEDDGGPGTPVAMAA